MALLLAGCASDTSAPLVDYRPESFDASNAYARHYAAAPVRACEAARRALLSQGYMVDEAKPGQINQVTGRKYFQPDRDHHVQLEFRVVCVAQGRSAGGGTVVFTSGLEDQYSPRKVKQSASLGVGAFGSLSLPFQGGTDSMVKVASKTVTDAGLYQRFFDLIDGLLENGEIPEHLMPPAVAAPASAMKPAPVPMLVQAQAPASAQALAAEPAAPVQAQAPASVPPAMPASAASSAGSAAVP